MLFGTTMLSVCVFLVTSHVNFYIFKITIFWALNHFLKYKNVCGKFLFINEKNYINHHFENSDFGNRAFLSLKLFYSIEILRLIQAINYLFILWVNSSQLFISILCLGTNLYGIQ